MHVLCYGVDFNDKNWKCSPCEANALQPVCKLCVQNGGALKKTVCGGWAHVLCGLFIEGCVFIDQNQMEPIDISNVSDSKRNKTCMFCKKDHGFAPLCSNKKCKNRLHISCADKNGCLKEDTNKNKKIKFRAYCFEHKPSTNRRISSEFFRGAVMKKKEKNVEKTDESQSKTKKDTQKREKIEKEKSCNMNVQWLIQQSLDENISPLEANDSTSSEKRKREKPPTANDDHPIPFKQVRNDNASFKLSPSMENIFSESNKENIFHVCYKDDEISKVSIFIITIHIFIVYNTEFSSI